MEFIRNLLKESGQVWFEGLNNYDKFARFYADLYRIELYKDGLDAILTKVKNKKLKFEIRIITNWDTNIGCYLTEQNKIYNKFLGKFNTQISQKIIIRQLLHNVIAHEMAHALDFSSGLNLNEDFRKAIGFDMKDRDPNFPTLKFDINRLMVDALKSYPQNQFIAELFARYFELLSISRDVCGKCDFETIHVTDFFINTTNYVRQIFNSQIKSQIDPEIAKATSELVQKIKNIEPEIKFSDRVESFYKKGGIESNQKWSKNVKSNFTLPQNLQKSQRIEDSNQ